MIFYTDKIPNHFIESVLLRAGYKKHRTINGKGFILPKEYEKRFHIYVKGNKIELHIDKKIKNKHRLVNYSQMGFIEIKRINKVFKTFLLTAPRRIKKKKSRYKCEYAKNLLELQKFSSTLNNRSI